MPAPIEIKVYEFKKGTPWEEFCIKMEGCIVGEHCTEKNLCENGVLKKAFNLCYMDEDFIQKIIPYLNTGWLSTGFYKPNIQWIPTDEKGE